MNVQGAACCNGGASSTLLITENHRFQVRLSTSYSEVVAEKFESDKVLFWDTDRKQVTQTQRLAFNHIFAERWQWGTSFDLVSKNYRFDNKSDERTDFSLGDSRLLLAYELLTPTPTFDLTPQLFLSVQHTFITGRGLIDSRKAGLTDVSGSEQEQTQVGLHANKQMSGKRFSLELILGRKHERKVGDKELLAIYDSQWRCALTLTSRKSSWSGGVSVGGLYSQGRQVEMLGQELKASDSGVYEVVPYLNYAVDDTMLITLSYLDQTILGPTYNTTLSRALSLSLVLIKIQ